MNKTLFHKSLQFIVFCLFFITPLFSARVDTVLIHSKSMGKDLYAIVVLPEEHNHTTTLFPVVYLLHGYGGDYRNWSKHADLGMAADEFGFILVCPDGGKSSWYLDSPIDPRSQYESFITGELVLWIDSHYHTIPDRKGRVITGLSMGGHGALFLAIRHPDIYRAVGSMSGGVDLTYSTKKWELAQRLGSYESFPERWHDNSVVNMVDQLVNIDLAIVVDCGVDDFFIEINRKLHKKLLDSKVPHDYYERPGRHNWNYWVNALSYHLLFFEKTFER